MANLIAYSLVIVLAAISFAAPHPAVNRIDAPGHRSHSTTIISSELAISSSKAPHITLKAREPAVNRIDAVDDNVHHKLTSSSAHSSNFRTLVSTTEGPHIALNPRDPAVNRIDAVGIKVHHRTTTSPINFESSVSLSSSSIRPYITLNPRKPAVNRIDAPGHKPRLATLTSSAASTSSSERPHAPVMERAPAVNRIDAVGNGVVDEGLFSVAGGTPVTLAISDIQQLEAAATETIAAAAVPMPVISVNPSADNTVVPATFFAGPAPGSSAIPVNIPGAQTVIYITLRPDRPIAKTDMGQALLHAMSDLSQSIKKNGEDGRLPEDDWSWFAQGWDCLLTADRNLILGPGGRRQHLTYGNLHAALVGLWTAVYSEGRYFACEFGIEDARWGVVGSGSMDSWGRLAGSPTTS